MHDQESKVHWKTFITRNNNNPVSWQLITKMCVLSPRFGLLQDAQLNHKYLYQQVVYFVYAKMSLFHVDESKKVSLFYVDECHMPTQADNVHSLECSGRFGGTCTSPRFYVSKTGKVMCLRQVKLDKFPMGRTWVQNHSPYTNAIGDTT